MPLYGMGQTFTYLRRYRALSDPAIHNVRTGKGVRAMSGLIRHITGRASKVAGSPPVLLPAVIITSTLAFAGRHLGFSDLWRFGINISSVVTGLMLLGRIKRDEAPKLPFDRLYARHDRTNQKGKGSA